MRVFILLPILIFIGACSNVVVSEKPWFSASAGASAPRLKPGVWVSDGPVLDAKMLAELGPARAKMNTCRFDVRKPAYRWPDCVTWYVVRDEEYFRLTSLTSSWQKFPDYAWSPSPFVLAPGEPRISQVEGCPGVSHMYEPDENGDLKPTDPNNYCYSAVRPTRYDDAGQISAVITWSIKCGPIQDDDKETGTTTHPFPGLHVGKNNCIAESEKALREAAILSEDMELGLNDAMIGAGKVASHWVRDGYR